MYSIICKNRQAILDVIDQENKQTKALSTYESLIQEGKQQPWSTDFEGRYRRFWTMRGMGAGFYPPYFQALKAACTQAPSISQLCTNFLPISMRKKKGTQQTIQTVQFSFPTKLCHTADPRLPIYDERVARFYLFQEPSTTLSPSLRINWICCVLRLPKERILACSGAQPAKRPAIDDFKNRFTPKQHTDEKIIDWRIWRS
jgi:hypothetical protein